MPGRYVPWLDKGYRPAFSRENAQLAKQGKLGGDERRELSEELPPIGIIFPVMRGEAQVVRESFI